MPKAKTTPELRKHRYGTPGRTLEDWDVLAFTWKSSSAVRKLCNDSFTEFEFHAYAEPRTQVFREGRELTWRLWQEMERLGHKVNRTVHFSAKGGDQ